MIIPIILLTIIPIRLLVIISIATIEIDFSPKISINLIVITPIIINPVMIRKIPTSLIIIKVINIDLIIIGVVEIKSSGVIEMKYSITIIIGAVDFPAGAAERE